MKGNVGLWLRNYSENFGSLKGNVSLDCRPLGVPLTAGIGMSIKAETERLEIGEIQLGNRWKYNLVIDRNTTRMYIWKYDLEIDGNTTWT